MMSLQSSNNFIRNFVFKGFRISGFSFHFTQAGINWKLLKLEPFFGFRSWLRLWNVLSGMILQIFFDIFQELWYSQAAKHSEVIQEVLWKVGFVGFGPSLRNFGQFLNDMLVDFRSVCLIVGLIFLVSLFMIFDSELKWMVLDLP
jgi:hypothetical protein